jgi:hypothetical protein
VQVSVRTDVSVLHNILGIGSVSQNGNCDPEETLPVAAHDDGEEFLLACEYASNDFFVRQ